MTFSMPNQENQLANDLLHKLQTKSAKVGVIGLGYVGLPLAVEKAKTGYHVIGFDIQEKRVDLLNQGINYIGDVVDEELAELVKKKQLFATKDYSLIAQLDALAICVPTPLDIYKQPDTSYVESSAKEISKYIRKGMLIVLESTTYPGTTEDLVKPLLEQSGLVCGVDFFLAYSPERVDPGNKHFNTKNTPKVVGGITPNCTTIAATLYRNVLEGEVHLVSSPKIAEMEKILENTFRNINIALANEMAILCHKMGIDVWEVIEAASSKPYGFMPFYPGPGLGGHCIPIDPWYLTWKAREFDYHTRLIETAGEINNSMPEFVLNRIADLLNQASKSVKGATVTLLGVAYKKDVSDYRESAVLKIIELLQSKGATVRTVDPHIAQFKLNGQMYSSEPLSSELLESSDLVVLTTNHSDFNYEWIANHHITIFDTRNAFKSAKGKAIIERL